MKRSTLAVILALLAIVAVAGVLYAVSGDDGNDNETTVTTTDTASTPQGTNDNGDTTPQEETSTDTTPSATDEVSIQNYAFTPSNVTVKKGTAITWTNQDTVGHDVTPDNETDEFKQSDSLSKGESYTVTFNTPGTYTYYCSPHPYMKGTVTVTE